MFHTAFAKIAAQDSSPDSTWYRAQPYDPPFLRVISDADDQTLIDWYAETKATYPNAGASGVEMMAMLTGLVMGAGIKHMVQCGHYVGFSTLILGMIARQMGAERFLYTVDIEPEPSAYTAKWLERAQLQPYVHVSVHDSSDSVCVAEALAFHGKPPQLVYIDSSHQYEHTCAELRLWWAALPPGGLLVMDDVSGWAAEFDRSKRGGSHRAAMEFRLHHAPNSIVLNSDLYSDAKGLPIYTDVCGFGLFQKPQR